MFFFFTGELRRLRNARHRTMRRSHCVNSRAPRATIDVGARRKSAKTERVQGPGDTLHGAIAALHGVVAVQY